jgi:hypothetical protein
MHENVTCVQLPGGNSDLFIETCYIIPVIVDQLGDSRATVFF